MIIIMSTLFIILFSEGLPKSTCCTQPKNGNAHSFLEEGNVQKLHLVHGFIIFLGLICVSWIFFRFAGNYIVHKDFDAHRVFLTTVNMC